MRKPNVLLVAIPAFVLGGLCAALLTSSAHGQTYNPVQVKDVPPAKESFWEYKIVTGGELNVYGAQGFEYCGESAASVSNGVDRLYTLRKKR